MILVDGEKYACVQCIRGHRSSTCRHSARPLVQVRSRGRPSLNQTHRIAVTQSELVLSKEEADIRASVADATRPKQEVANGSCCNKIPSPSPLGTKRTKGSCCSSRKPTKMTCCAQTIDACKCNNQSGVILLKASKRELVDVNGGSLDFVGPYNGTPTTKFRVHGVTKPKHTKSSTCSTKSGPLKAVKTLKVNEVPSFMDFQHQFQYHLAEPIPQDQQQMQPNFADRHSQAVISQIDIDKYLMEHQNLTQSNHKQHNNHFPHSDYPIQQFQEIPQVPKSSQLFDMFVAEGCADECHCGPECGCPGCLIHRTNEELKEYGILDSSSTTTSTPAELKDITLSNTQRPANAVKLEETASVNGSLHNGQTPELTAQNMINFHTIDELLLEDMFNEDCGCDPTECICYNCIKHGISEGIRLFDGVRVSGWSYASSAVNQNGSTVDDEIHDCGCAPGECECYNCSMHGRENGVKVL